MNTRAARCSAETTWRRELRDAVRSLPDLLQAVELETDQLPWSPDPDPAFELLVPRSFVERMHKGDPLDPLLRQVLPLARERLDDPQLSRDPLTESVFAAEGLVHKYRGRALLITTGACAINCRYCFRRDFPYAAHGLHRDRWASAVERLRHDPNLEEVILSGGDPLVLSNERLAEIFDTLDNELPNLRSVRIHTRLPIVLPSRVDAGLLDMLGRQRRPVTLVVHCNHAQELDGAVSDRLRALRSRVDALLNQSVLLAGVNDDEDALVDLSWALFEAGVLPYYLHLADPVQGTAHLRVPQPAAQALHKTIHARLPGYLVPRLVREVPGASGKTAIDSSAQKTT